jgi:ATP-dependent 26S proteasome regulatory subunit
VPTAGKVLARLKPRATGLCQIRVFDHTIEVGYPSAEEVRAALQEILSERPHKTIDLDSLSANLAGRPMSDVAWVVNDAARAAARAKKDAIDQADLMAAADRLGALAGNNSNEPG